MLSSPVLMTLFGRLSFPAGEPAPPGPVDVGLLSPSIFNMNLSNSPRWSARPGVGDISYGLSTLDHAGLRGSSTSLVLPILCLPAETSFARNSLWRLSSASFAFFARISSLRCCIMLMMHAHLEGTESLSKNVRS